MESLKLKRILILLMIKQTLNTMELWKMQDLLKLKLLRKNKQKLLKLLQVSMKQQQLSVFKNPLIAEAVKLEGEDKKSFKFFLPKA